MNNKHRVFLSTATGLAASVLPVCAIAGINSNITATWSRLGESTPVPTLSSYGLAALAVLVGLLLYRSLYKNPRMSNLLALASVATLVVSTAIWTANVYSGYNGTVTIIDQGGECNSGSVSYRDDEDPPYALANDCPNPVRVSYSVTQSNCGVQDLSCLEPSTGLECVGEGEIVPAGGEREFLGCYLSQTLSDAK